MKKVTVFVLGLYEYLFRYRINTKIERIPLKGSLPFALSVVSAYMLLLMTFRFFVLSCGKAPVVRL